MILLSIDPGKRHCGVVLSIDPGKRHCGVALWKDGELQRAALVKSASKQDDLSSIAQAMAQGLYRWVKYDFELISRVVCEYPRTYGGRSKKGDASDLIDLGIVVGYITSMLVGHSDAGLELVLPQEWGAPGKGHLTSKKAYEAQGYVPEARARRDLTPAELSRVEWGNDWKRRLDVADALGIGFWWLRANGVRR